MALLTVLLLVALMSVLAVALLDDLRFSVRRTTNSESGAQARWHALGAEALAMRLIERLKDADPARTSITPDWNGRSRDFPIDGGGIRIVVADGQNCFNLNSVVEGYGEFLARREAGRAQLLALALSRGISETRSRAIVDALTDWMDADSSPHPDGAEDSAYASAARPYRTGGVLLAEVSELRAIRGVDAAAYRALRPFVCALPTPDPAALNVNTLTPEEAPLLVMLTGGRLSASAARSVIARRPANGWRDVESFWSQPVLKSVGTGATQQQTTVRTRFFDLRIDVDFAGARVVRTTLVEVDRDGRAHARLQRWTPED